MSIFEAGMLICFGAAWPMNIINSLRTKSSKGKNLPFQIAILVGYICGITHKILYSQDIVMVLYIINFVMVSTGSRFARLRRWVSASASLPRR